MKFNKHSPIHVFLFSVYPAVVLLAINIQEARIESGFRAIIISFFLGVFLFILLNALIKNWHRSAIFISIFMVWFFSYGHIYFSFKQNDILSGILGRHRFLLPIWMILLIGGLWIAAKKSKDLIQITQILNFVGIFLMIWPTWQIVTFKIQDAINSAQLSEAPSETVNFSTNENLPDVYYIILDAYSRNDVLESIYGFDNSQFLTELSDLGFYIAECSRSNYDVTRLSLASSLNRNYLQNLENNDPSDEAYGWRLITHNQVRKDFEKLGYSIIAFETAYYWTELDDADIYLSNTYGGANNLLGNLRFSNTLNNFETLFIQTTLIQAVLDLIINDSQNATSIKSKRGQFERVNFTLDNLPDIAKITDPTFAFVHIVAPHPPYVFDAEGDFISEGGSHIGQLSYINSRIIEVVKLIQINSSSPPIIIIQGDHASPDAIGTPSHLNILNAYYFPDVNYNPVYENITPVNTFRIVFDTYFNTDFGLLEDISYFSAPNNVYAFKAVPDTKESCNP